MKIVIMRTLMLVALVSLTTLQVKANLISTISTISEEKVITLTLDENSNEYVEVKIVDTNGLELLEEKFDSKVTKNRKYNLKNLPKGKYFLKVYDSQKIITRDINLGYDNVTIGTEETLFKPSIKFLDGSWRISYLAQGKTASISITDQEGNELIEDRIRKETIINKIYNLQKLDAGIYRIVVKTDNQYFSHIVAKA